MIPLGISSWFGYELPLNERLDMIVKVDFSTTCLWLGEEEGMVSNGQADAMPEMVRERGLTLDNVHAPFRHCNFFRSESQSEKLLVRQDYEKSLFFCDKHHIPIMVIHITGGTNPPPLTRAGMQIIRDLVSLAENAGVTIALENTRRPDYLEAIFSEIQSANLGFCYDSSHDFLHGQSQGRLLKKWGSFLATTHISDSKGDSDDHLLLGEGTIDWHKFAESFPRSTYNGPLLLEVEKHDAELPPERFLQMSYEKVRELAEMLE